MWIFDATPLIYLAKVGRLSLVQYLEESCVIPERVYGEVVETGREQGYPDARRIERAVENDLFDVVTVADTPLVSRLRQNSRFSDADVDVLVCTATHDGVAVMDETYGRDVAMTENITTRGTAYFVLLLVSRRAIDAATARTTIDAMIDEGWYCAPDVYAKIVREIEALAD